MTPITSRQNPRVKNLVKLRQRKERTRQGLFLVEGVLEIERLLDAGQPLKEFYVCAESVRQEGLALVQRVCELEGVLVFELPASVFEKVCYREGSDGLLAVAPTWELGLERLKLGECPLVIVAESIEKPGNLGSLIRSAEAAGADALIVCDPVCDVFNPNVVRASRGLVSARKIAVDTPEAVRDFLKARGVKTVALMPEAKALHWEVDLSVACAVVAGSEWAGLSTFWEDAADEQLRLPMNGAGDSLNVSVATAVTLYEALRQRALS